MKKTENGLEEAAAAIAHEIKNPLALIKANLQLMELDGEIKRRYQKNFRAMYKEIDRANQLLMEFIQSTKPQEYHMEKTELCRLLWEVIWEMDAALKKRQIQMHFDGSRKPVYIWADYRKMKGVFLNMIKNAMEAIGQGGDIYITVFRSEGFLAVKIEDNGHGIAEKYLDKIGTPYFTTKIGGSGLGIANAKKITEAHGGVFSFSSIEGKGSTAAVALPELKDKG